MLTPEQRSLRSRLGGLTTAARGHVNTGPARAAFAERFYAGIRPDLPQHERDRRAEAARRLYMAQLAFRSSRARSSKKAASTGNHEVETAQGGSRGGDNLPD